MINSKQSPSQNSSITRRAKLYQVLESDVHSSVLAKCITYFLITLIVSNVIAAIFESEANFHERFEQQFFIFEVLSLSIFCIEYLMRIWCCVEAPKFSHLSPLKARFRYAMSPIALIDLIAILPFIIAIFLAVDLRALRLLRVLRLLKLTHYFKGFNIFITVVSKELKSITAAMMVILFLIIIAASLMHTIEGKIQPEVFGSILHSFWWAVVTMTTVGYGDVVPITPLGKLVSTFIMLIGIGLVALPAGMLAARFGEELRERKKKLNVYIESALTDGTIDKGEYQSLVELADKLEINPDDLHRSIRLIKQGKHSKHCPHCGK